MLPEKPGFKYRFPFADQSDQDLAAPDAFKV
jgi:hypothetical protein